LFNPTINAKLAKSKLDQIVQELQSEKLFLTCGKHQYVATVKGGVVNPPAPRGCPDCWKAYYFTVHCLCAPHMRAEHLDELESVIRHTVEYCEKGQFGSDFELYSPGDPRFKVSFDKEPDHPTKENK
jgi:hypothetical protein